MEQIKFLELLAEQFDCDPKKLQMDLEFRKLEEWSSIVALSVIAMADEEYNVVLTGADIQKSTTIGQLYKAIAQK